MPTTALLLHIAIAHLLQGSVAGPPLTLNEAIRESQTHSDAMRAARDSLNASRARVGQQNALRNPQIGIVGSATQYDAPSNLNFAGAKVQAVPDHTEALSLQLNQILDFSNQIGTAASQSRLLALSYEYGFESTSNDVALTTTTAFLDVLRTEQNVAVEQAALDSYQEQLKLNTKLYQGGVGPKINVLRAESQASNSESELVRRQNERNEAKSRLNDLIGKPLDDPLSLADPTQNDATTQSLDRHALIKQALDRRPEALAATVQVRAAEKGIKLARSSTDPQVSIGLSGNYYPTTSFQETRQTTAALTLGVTIPLYDGGLAKERVNEARATLDSAKANANQVRRNIALEVQNAAIDVETARKRVTAAKVSVASATAARDLAHQRYEAQVSLYLEVTDAQSALTSAQAALVDANYDLLTAQARLSRALGEPFLH